MQLGGYSLSLFRLTNGGNGDDRVYAGGELLINQNGNLVLALTNSRISMEIDYLHNTVIGSGWATLDATTGNETLREELDPYGTGQVALEFTSFSPLVQGTCGQYAFDLTVKPVHYQEHIVSQAVTAPLTLAFPQAHVSLTVKTCVAGGPDSDQNDLLVNQIMTAGGGAAPAGIEAISPYCYWELGTVLSSITTDVTFDLTGMPGVENPDDLRILRRDNASAAWEIYPDQTAPGMGGLGAREIRANGVVHLGQWAIGKIVDDNDGIPSPEEQGPAGNDPNYDGNGDGIPDVQQGSVASFHASTGAYVTIACSPDLRLRNVAAVGNPSPGDAPAGLNMPCGFFDFQVTGLAAGGATVVDIHVPDGAVIDSYYKYGPTPEQRTPHWYEFSFDGTTGAEIDGDVIHLHFVDGQRGDDDLTANGVVVEPGAPVLENPPVAAGWTRVDIGAPTPSSITTYDPATGTWTIQASGSDIWGTADQFCLVYRYLHGDGQITARVVSIGNATNQWCKVGVMMRESLDAGSNDAYMVMTPGAAEDHAETFQWRSASNPNGGYVGGGSMGLPYWVRLVRQGDTFIGYYSSNGSDWAEAGEVTIPMRANGEEAGCYIGLCVTSHAAGSLCTATVDNVSIATSGTGTVTGQPVPQWQAWGPSPANGETMGTRPSPCLRWNAGDQAAGHEVFFGTDAAAVANATTATAGIYKGTQATDANSYDPGPLAVHTTYYWRIDEVNAADPSNPWKGDVWSFTVVPVYTLTLTAGPGGTASFNPQQVYFREGTPVQLSADPASGYSFAGWSGAVDGKGNPRTIVMDADKTITATFEANSTSPSLALGTNLGPVLDWSADWVFVDQFKMARAWVTQDVTNWDWDSGKEAEIPLDANGWPTQVPFTASDGSSQIVHTVMPAFVPGEYTVLVDGAGEIVFGGAAYADLSPAGGTNNRYTITVAPGKQGPVSLFMAIRLSLAADPIRNIRVIMPGFESTYQTQPFHPLFLQRLQPFSCLRFEDWGRIDDSPLVTWDQRTTLTTYTQTRDEGVALEYMAELANTLHQDLWICIPHQADDNYVHQAAQLLRDMVDPGLKIYVEYSSETWRDPRASYVCDQGQALGLDADRWQAGQKYVALRSVQIWEIFAQEFGGESRLVKVMAGACYWDGITEARLAGLNDPSLNPHYTMADVLAIAPSFGKAFLPADLPPNTSRYPTVDEIVGPVSTACIAETQSRVLTQKALADRQGCALVGYQGALGFLAGGGAESDATLTALLVAANRDPRMCDCYLAYFRMLAASGVTLFNHLTYVGSPSEWGAWGALESMDQPIEETPRYRALADWVGYVEPEITVLGNGVSITDDDTTPSAADDTDFGTVVQGGAPLSHTFTVRNDGGSTLNLWPVSVPGGFTVTKGLPASLAPGAFDTFTIRLDTTVWGTEAGQVSFANDDTDENLFTFRITGTVNRQGRLDPSFGGTGKVTTPIGSSGDYGNSVALQPDGKIVVAGSSVNSSTYHTEFAVARYNPDGSLDSSFGGTGKVTTPIGSFDDEGRSVALQSDGKIVVAGYSYNGSDAEFAVVRYNADGSLDLSFGGTGKVTTPIGLSYADGYSVALQSDGKIVVAGDSDNGSDADFAVVRYNPDGSLDLSFGGTGKVTTPIGASHDWGRVVAIQSDGRIVVAGYSDGGSLSNEDFAVVRYLPDGSLDLSFGATGKVTTPITGSSSDYAYGVALQSDGRIVVAGYSLDYDGSSGEDFALVRYHPDGSLDPSFGAGTGKVTTPIGEQDDQGYGVAIQPDGKIVVAGRSYVPGFDLFYTDFAVARYNPDGSLDTSFGTGGKVTTPIGVLWDDGSSVALQSDGQIVVAGSSFNGASRYGAGNFDFAVARYDSTGWTSVDIGGPAPSSTTAYDEATGTWTIQASGSDIGGAADQFCLVYRYLQGDGQITARVVSSTGGDPCWCKVGVMMRESLDASSNDASMVMRGAAENQAEAFQWRSPSDPNCGSQSGGPMSLPYWVRLVRQGDTFIGYYSSNGSDWTQAGEVTIPMRTKGGEAGCYIGLCVTSHAVWNLCTATIDHVSITTSGTGEVMNQPPPQWQAWGPDPVNGSTVGTIPALALLQWNAGDQAAGHEVFFGTDAAAVANATTATAGIYKGTQAADATSYDPGPLAVNTTYYWRIDEVDAADPLHPWKGDVWSFTVVPAYTLTLTTSPGGTASFNPQQAYFKEGTPVQLSAAPETGYSFAGWTGDVEGKGNPRTIVMDADKTVTASFEANSTAPMALGMNVGAGSDWLTDWLWVDQFKVAREWSTEDKWSASESPAIPLDANGWPTQVPFVASDGKEHFVHTVMPAPVPGEYTVLVDGTGEIVFWGAANADLHPAGGTNNRYTITVLPGKEGPTTLFMDLRQSLASDPIRNIRVIMPGFESTYQSQPFHPLTLERLEPFTCLRFKDWTWTDGSLVATWDQRTTPDSYTQARLGARLWSIWSCWPTRCTKTCGSAFPARRMTTTSGRPPGCCAIPWTPASRFTLSIPTKPGTGPTRTASRSTM